MKKSVTVTTEVTTDVDVEIDVDEVLDELSDDHLKEEMKSRGFYVLERKEYFDHVLTKDEMRIAINALERICDRGSRFNDMRSLIGKLYYLLGK